MQQNGIKSLHYNRNSLEQKLRCSNIPGRLHQSPAQLAQEHKSIPVDWTVGLHRNRDEFTYDDSPAYFSTLLDAANSAAATAWRDEASRYESAVVKDTRHPI